MLHFICEKCGERFGGGGVGEFCSKCGSKLKEISEKEFDKIIKEKDEREKKKKGD